MAVDSNLQKLLRSEQITAFEPIDDHVVDDFENHWGLNYSGSFRGFLRSSNGLKLQQSTAGNDLIGEIRALCGIGNLDPHADLQLKISTGLSFYRNDFLPFAAIIGFGYEGSPVCEISVGSRKGEIMFADHEVYHGMADQFQTLGSPDDVTSEFVTSGWFNPIAGSFDDLLGKLANSL
ncbi:MAG: hypothetical protein ACRECY_01140 [Phyllobacterium sp.]